MKKSLRAKRMAKHHRRMGAAPKLNLVSLMDIFTILVFFLLFNSSDVEVLSSDKSIKLPESLSTQKPDTTLLIKVNNEDLLVGSLAVAKVRDVLASGELTIAALEKELHYQASRSQLSELEKEKGRAVTIMGDKSVPYTLLKKIMATCAANDFRDISLSVAQVQTAVGTAAEGEIN
ncbi:MAG: biopolymer transporter ExbD [Cellvibrionaceae bacterium]|nr:biopolymer transporter ExbD [Cellvibrionaceae bacterium]